MKYILAVCFWLNCVALVRGGFHQTVPGDPSPSCPASHLCQLLRGENCTTPEQFCNASKVTYVESTPLKRMKHSSLCSSQLDHLVKHYGSFEEQSHNIINDLQARLSRLQDVWPSSFQECLNVRDSSLSGSRGSKIRGQYCLTYFLPPSEDQMTGDEIMLLQNERSESRYPIAIPQTGICIPSACTPADVKEYLKALLGESADNYTILIHSYECQVDNPKPISLFTKIVMAFIVIIFIAAVIGTTIEVSEFRKKSKAVLNAPNAEKTESYTHDSIFKCFSLFSNSWFLFKMDTGVPGEIEAFNGAKFISISACGLVHFIGLSCNNTWSNLHEAHYLHSITDKGGFFYLQLFLQTMVAMSGAGIMMSAMHRIRVKDKGFNLIPFYLRRVWRLSIPYFFLIAVVIGVVPYLGSGPKWPDVLRTVENCQKYWWRNVLFINNYVPYPICMFHSWYLSADLQLLLLAPILILAFNRSARMGFACSSLFIGYSVAKIFYHAYFDSLNAWDVTISQDTKTVRNYFHQLYFPLYSRIGCYTVGIITGYIVHTYGREIPFSKTHHHWITVIATFFGFSPLWLWYRYTITSLPTPTKLEVALCEALCRVLFTSSSAYVCLSVYAGRQDGITRFFRRVFCQKLYVFTSKLQYSAFLIHVIIIEVYLGTRPEPMEYTTFKLLMLVVGLLVLTHLIAIPFTLLVVFPFARLEMVLEQRWKKTKTMNKDVKQS